MRGLINAIELLGPETESLGPGKCAGEDDLQDVLAELASFRTALDPHTIVGITDRTGTITNVNDRFCQISKYSRLELIGAKHSLLNSGHHPPAFFQEMWRVISGGVLWHGEICNRAKDGSLYWVDTTIAPKMDGSGRICGYVSIRYDITQRKQAEKALNDENLRRERVEMLLRDIIETLPNGVAAYDENDRLILFNSGFKEYYRRAGSAIAEGRRFQDILEDAVACGEFAELSCRDDDWQNWINARLRTHRNPGRAFLQALSGDRWIKVQERRSASGYVVGVQTDVTDLKRAERQVKLQAQADPLTGLLNRRALIERLTAILSSQRVERHSALVLIDLDGFKAINDMHGHGAGDTLLIEVGKRFRDNVRKSDIVARLGGDEYAVLLVDVGSKANAIRIVRKLLRSLESPVRLGRKSVRVSGSFGLTIVRKSKAGTPLKVFKRADIALYRAKHNGRSTYAVYSTDMERSIRQREAMIEALRRAIAQGEIQVAMQPQARFVDRGHAGFEALVRWQKDNQWVPAAEIVSLAEQSDLICALGRAVLAGTLNAMSEMKRKGFAPGKVAVNVAAAQLRNPNFAKELLDAVSAHGHSASEIIIEVTEGVILDRTSEAIGVTLNRLFDAGVKIALDDFGTGYASLTHLQRYPVSYIKIDRSFVRDVGHDHGCNAIVGAVTSLAHSLGMEVVAEGVETPSQYQSLLETGCDYAQGYLVAKPILIEEIDTYLLNCEANRPVFTFVV
ncbi:EAL domain-containing protein [Rhizobium calliandrae]|uniref:EAL domain-containing protein n=1 Tax=Rhizobium calliandrae TaxID=1312182 RepID=A0ABT7KPJ9_9HYPH|nr:EAL domain-containing protein [Rhizobium calliandrae]MDL2410556.1 EAL domain-containing protein [Rhizobium calliandrae]